MRRPDPWPSTTLSRTLVAVTLVVCLVALSLPAARAAPASASAEARAHYDRGIWAYNSGRFEQAVEAFTRAHALDPAPILLFNIAQAQWKKGDDEQALVFYRRYLQADPGGENRQRAEARIRELEARSARPSSPAAGQPPPPSAAPPVSPAEPAAPQRPRVVTPAPANPGAPAVVLAAVPAPSRPPLHRQPWFWAAVGAASVVAVASIFALRSDRSFSCGSGCPTFTVE